MRKRYVLCALTVVAGLVGWYLFRPELLFVNARVNESLPDNDDPRQMVLARGSFHGVSHESRGTAAIHQMADGRRILRLTEFETSNGPALKVYLIAAADATDSDAVKRAAIVDLGVLKGNIGDQNYDLPAEVDLREYRAVTIWCERFGVNFATAPLAVDETVVQSAAAR